jgi:hypothetical protein
MRDAWLIGTSEQGQQRVCVPGPDGSPEEQQAQAAGCEWDGGYCTGTEGAAGGTWVCPAGAASRLGIRSPSGESSPIQTYLLYGLGISVIGLLGLLTYHLLVGSRRT